MTIYDAIPNVIYYALPRAKAIYDATPILGKNTKSRGENQVTTWDKLLRGMSIKLSDKVQVRIIFK